MQNVIAVQEDTDELVALGTHPKHFAYDTRNFDCKTQLINVLEHKGFDYQVMYLYLDILARDLSLYQPQVPETSFPRIFAMPWTLQAINCLIRVNVDENSFPDLTYRKEWVLIG